MKKLTAERLREVLNYCPETGNFYWRLQLNSRSVVGSIAGKRDKLYVYIGIDRARYAAHQLAWLYMTGRWPHPLIDHIDGDGHNNAFANLREATHRQNQFNRKAMAGCKSGYKGVTKHSPCGRWQARIRIEGKTKHLGYFDTPESARDAYLAAARQYHGEFANFEK